MHEASSKLSRRGLLALPLVAGAVLAGCAAEPPKPARPPVASSPKPAETPEPEQAPMLLIASLAHEAHLAVIDPAQPDETAVRRVEVGTAPWGVGVHAETGTAYAATAEGLAVVDIARGERTLLAAYQHPVARLGFGEYRPGGLGVAVAPDGTRVYVAVITDGGSCFLEVFDVAAGTFTASVPVGARPFDVLVAPDGSWAATVDHDSFTVTVVDAATLASVTHTVAPFGTVGGLASWEKPHYGAVDAAGRILLPYQGLVVARLDPRSGAFDTVSSTANSHSHGTTLAGGELLTVGTGAFGNASGAPNLSILDLGSGAERIAPLGRPHETVAGWRDAAGCGFAAVAGGNTRDEGWDGVTLVALDDLSQREIPVPGYPQAIVAFASR